jgi:predicted O-methyltransferase YrrM
LATSFHQVKSYINHWLHEVDEHSIHSPFFYDLYTRTVDNKKHREDIYLLQKLRTSLLDNDTVLSIEDMGSGGKKNPQVNRTIADLALHSVTPAQIALFYLDLLYYSKAKRVVELGTSLGLTSLYLAQKKDAMIYTFEGSHSIANAAITNFEWAEQKNIELIEGNIDNTLYRFLEQTQKVDFVLIDANHLYGPTMRYYQFLTKRLTEKSVVIIDDIHRSPEMEKAWREIKSDVLVYGSVDLYRCGILLFDPVLNKQHFVWSLK